MTVFVVQQKGEALALARIYKHKVLKNLTNASVFYSTVTDLAKLRGLSTSVPFTSAA